MEITTAVSALAALAHPARLGVFRLLVQAGSAGMAAGQISAATGMAPSSLSFHLKELSHAGLASSRAEGRFVIYAANMDSTAALIAFLTSHCCGGQDCGLPQPVRSTQHDSL